jgi:hypothetical protein
MSKPKPDSETIRDYARAAYEGSKQYYEYLEAHAIPVLKSVLNRSPYEEAMTLLYYRSHLLMRGLTRLDHVEDFQSVRSIARSLFELVLDMKLLQHDPTLLTKFSSYPTVERIRTAIRVADFVAAHPSADRAKRYRYQISLAGDAAEIKKCEDILQEVYGITTTISTDRARRFPKTWSQMDVRTQGARLGIDEEEKYIAVYAIDSWFIHGGLTGVAGISQDGLANVYGRGHLLAQKSYHGATFVIAKELKLFDAQADLWSKLNELESLSATLLDSLVSRRAAAH